MVVVEGRSQRGGFEKKVVRRRFFLFRADLKGESSFVSCGWPRELMADRDMEAFSSFVQTTLLHRLHRLSFSKLFYHHHYTHFFLSFFPTKEKKHHDVNIDRTHRLYTPDTHSHLFFKFK